jgi:colicin import membrane protein
MTQEMSIFKKVESLVPSTIFSQGGIQPILDAIEKEVSQEVPDTSTDKGRKAIASNAAKVSKSKTLLDKMGKELTDKLNLAIKPINAERKLARDTLDALRDKTRQPLNQYEADEQAAAVAKYQKAEAEKLAIQIESDHEFGLMLNEKVDRDAADLKAKEEAERLELEAKELKELEARNEQIAKDAAEAERARSAQAIKDAEQRLIDQAVESKRLQIEAAATIESNRLKAERQVLQQQEDAKALKLQGIQDAMDAVAQAKVDQQKAIDDQKAKYEAKKVAEKAEADKRQADEDHCRKFNLEAVKCLRHGGLSEENSILAVRLIAAKRVTNIVINY